MKRTVMILATLLPIGCSKSDDGGATSGGTRAASYTLSTRADEQDPPGGLKVSATVPAAWKQRIDMTGSPQFEIEGLCPIGRADVPYPDLPPFCGPSIVLIHAPDVPSAIDRQYEAADLAAATREDKPDGRVWIAHTASSGHVHARMFIPAPTAQAVLMCVATLRPDGAKQLAAIKSMCETVAIGG